MIKSLRDNGAETMLIGVINIDLWPPNDPAQRKDIKQLYQEYRSVMNKLGMSQGNFKPTRFQSGSNPSLLDHIFVSLPYKLDAVENWPRFITENKKLFRCIVFSQKLYIRRQKV